MEKYGIWKKNSRNVDFKIKIHLFFFN
uniref:Uncharacterized protein n=1 Tax=Megaselia scalaris TaxID=36166 RepID=T1GPE3_MEGSC